MSIEGQNLLYIFSLLPTDWPVEACGQQAASSPPQSHMTDLKDSSLSPLLQITSSDMFGHSDNVLSENSFSGLDGIQAFNPQGGLLFQLLLYPSEERTQGDQKERKRLRPSKAGIKDCKRQWSPMN